MDDKDKDLRNYVSKAKGISRKGLNITCFIGVFIFGWLLAVAFEYLGKKRLGWLYVIPIIVFLVNSRDGFIPAKVLAAVTYVIGWVHANAVLSGYRATARRWIAQIDGLPAEQRTIDRLLEKGILQSKVLSEFDSAAMTFSDALRLPGGDPMLLNFAGARLCNRKRFVEAKQFFDRALPLATEGKLIEWIKRNQAAVEKKLR